MTPERIKELYQPVLDAGDALRAHAEMTDAMRPKAGTVDEIVETLRLMAGKSADEQRRDIDQWVCDDLVVVRAVSVYLATLAENAERLIPEHTDTMRLQAALGLMDLRLTLAPLIEVIGLQTEALREVVERSTQ